MNGLRVVIVCLALICGQSLSALQAPQIQIEEGGVLTVVFGNYSYVVTVGEYQQFFVIGNDENRVYQYDACVVFWDSGGPIDLGCNFELHWFETPIENGEGEAATMGTLLFLEPSNNSEGHCDFDADTKPRIDDTEGVIWSYMGPQ